MHNDHQEYIHFTPKLRIEKSINSLIGIVEGITIDSKINQLEMNFLNEWLNDHQVLIDQHPFTELVPVVEQAFADEILTEEEKLDILWLCEKLSKSDYFNRATVDIQRLHALMGGILADGIVSEDELKGLSAWLSEHEHLKKCWPYDEVESLVTGVMSDKHIDSKEQKILQQFFSNFVQVYDDKIIKQPLISENSTLQGLCAVCPEINFEGSKFCFTGASYRYKRKEFADIVKELGGVFSNSISKTLDYLVIGAEGNQCWAYACYGRKVEAAVNLRKQGHQILIVHEFDFHDAVADYID